MRDIRVARDLFQHYLPQELVKHLDFSKLRLSESSFVGNQLRSFLSDIIYEVAIDGQPGYLSILVEHKSEADKWL